MIVITLACDNIEATAATQVRTELHKDVIEQYQEDMENGALPAFPPLVVFCEQGAERYILSDGFHRLYAAINAGIKDIDVEVHVGGLHDALVFALGANAGHGLRRTRADKINAVKLALKDPELSQRTQQEIADVCRVHLNTVQRISLKPESFENTPKVDGENPSGEAEANKPTNNRPTKPEPTQEEVERGELRQAMALIKAFPYGGEDATKLHLEPDDVADLEYASAWCAHAVLVHRNGGKND